MTDSTARAVDIVVPVYNGYDDLVRCVESLKKHTDLKLHRVVLIDDCSPDERIRPFLSGVCGEDDTHGFVCVFNEENAGFSANVNTGLAWSDRDTILLNSDTVVTKGWVEKLIRCAYASERTATVTPLSNAATLASVPVFLKDQDIPEGYTVDSYAQLVEEVSLRRYPRVTVGVGFCMYVKQSAYEQVGPFDAKTFGRGYGEENDFCCRCTMAGFVHVLCDDTFIYHRGTASFDTEEKRALVEAHTQILRKRYPELMKANDAYCAEDPDREIRDNLLLHQLLRNGKKNLLYFLHLDFRQVAKNSIGGTQLHVQDLVREVRRSFNVFVASRDGNALRVTVYPADSPVQWDVLRSEESALSGGRLISLKFPIGEEEPYPVFYEESLAKVLKTVLAGFSVDLVHVHHTQGLSLDIFRVCRDLKIPVIATLHDYYYACPTTKLLTEKGRFCPDEDLFAAADPTDRPGEDARPVPDGKACMRCLHKNCGFGRVHVMERWRRECGKALDCCTQLIFPSESARSIFLQAYPKLREKCCVIPHGTDALFSARSEVPDFESVQKSGRVRTRLDQQPGREGGFHYVAGWACLDGADNAKTERFLEVTDKNGKVTTIAVRKTARPDVANASADPLLLWSGIHTVFSIPGFPDGPYRLRILIRYGDKVLTDGKVYSGKYAGEDSAKEGPAARFNIAFLGGVTPAKGSKLLADVIGAAPPDLNLYVFGQVGDPKVLERKGRAKTVFSGVYRREDIFDLLTAGSIDAACILPVWAETFCYTLSEAWSCGIPVIGTDIGAVGERIRETGAGWLVPADCGAEQLLELIDKIRSDPEDLARKREAVRALSLRSVEEMDAEYAERYADLTEKGGALRVNAEEMHEAREALMDGLALANPCVTGRSGAAARNRLLEENEMLKASMEMLKGTTSYRFARRIAEADIPFKEQLKKLLRKR